MTPRIVFDSDLCQAHAECTLEAPEVFVLPKGATKVEIHEEGLGDDTLEAVRRAVRYCPTHALALADDPREDDPA